MEIASDPNHKQAKTGTWGREGEGILGGSHVIRGSSGTMRRYTAGTDI